MEEHIDPQEFLREREEKLGNPIIYKAYATWFAEVGRERREFGVFLYTDGKVLVIEDFFRPAKVLGYELETRREEERRREFVKLELHIPREDITRIEYVSKSSAEASLRKQENVAKAPTVFNLLFTKNVTMMVAGGRTFFFELPSFKEFRKALEMQKENNA